MGLTSMDFLFLYALISIWIMLLYHIFLAFSGYRYHEEVYRDPGAVLSAIKEYPFVTILVPAHNEEKVIGRTVRAIMNMDYPQDKFELIVINDCSSDRTGEILQELQEDYNNLKVITVLPPEGGKGKAAALNRGLREAKGEYIVVYDADNTPERMALRYLVAAIVQDPQLASVVGKFRTRNKDRNILTRFINIETLGFQWISQAGRWKLFNISTIPGTNYIIRKSILDRLGGWNEKAITEDTELSIRVYEMGYREDTEFSMELYGLGYKIKFFPLAVTWEQEPETWKVWLKQRTRWVRGNIYVIGEYLFKLLSIKRKIIALDILYFFSIYFLFLSSVLISDIIFISEILGISNLTLEGPFFVLWVLAYILFVIEMAIAVNLEKGEGNLKNILLIALMYFTYCQMWILLTVRSFYLSFKDRLMGVKTVKWYKTERF